MIEIVKTVYSVIEAFFIVYLIVYTCFLVVSVTVGAITLYEQKRRNALFNYIQHDYYVPISVIVPAHNEQLTLIDTIHSLLSLKYKLYEIIIVDDGSTDETAKRVYEHFSMTKTQRPIRLKIPCSPAVSVYVTYDYKVPITLISKENGGKADALNLGINASEYPYVVCMDADSMLQSDALEKIARAVMEAKDVVAVGGLVRIVNDVTIDDGEVVDYKLPQQLLLCMQVMEYDRSFLASRLLFDKFNGNLIISGAFGLFKKDLLVSIGGYDSSTVGEDMELIVRIHAFARSNNIPYRIRYAPDAVCWSQAPSTYRDLKKQRRRWHIGLFESVHRHRQVLFNPAYGLLSLVSFSYFLIYELYSPYIEVFGICSIIIASFFGLVNVPFMLMLMAIYVTFNSVMSLTSFFSRIHAMDVKLKRSDAIKAVIVCVIENVGLRLLLTFTRFTALFGLKKKKISWGEIERFEHHHTNSEQQNKPANTAAAANTPLAADTEDHK